MTQDQFIEAMSAQEPLWFIDHATQSDLRQYIVDAQPGFNGQPRFTIAQLNSRMMRNVANRLYMPLRAAVHAGFLTDVITKV